MGGEVAPAPDGEGDVKAKTSKDPEMSVPTDEMANGPVADRSCTDLLCCLIFLAFLAFPPLYKLVDELSLKT